MRVVPKAVGLPVMEAHRTPRRSACHAYHRHPGRRTEPVKGVIAERPAALWEFSKEHSARGERRKWYADDKGRHAIAEILDLIEKIVALRQPLSCAGSV